jgi:hypothetical protein
MLCLLYLKQEKMTENSFLTSQFRLRNEIFHPIERNPEI